MMINMIRLFTVDLVAVNPPILKCEHYPDWLLEPMSESLCQFPVSSQAGSNLKQTLEIGAYLPHTATVWSTT